MLVLFGGGQSIGLARKIAQSLSIPLGTADTTPFPNGERMVRIESDVRNRDVFVVVSTGGSQGNDNLIELLIWGDALRRASAERITAVIPYFGYARQDRKAAGRMPISARLIGDLIEKAGFHRVLTMDLHADQIQGFFSIPLDHLNAGHLMSKNVVALSPDVGNLKKLDKYRRGFPDMDIAVIDKVRDPKTGEIKATRIIGDVEGKDILIGDDIISTAKTVREAVDIAIENGAAPNDDQGAYIIATHGEFVGEAINNLDHPKILRIAVTDTLELNDNTKRLPIEQLSTANLLGEAIRRIHEGKSISELLGKFG